ncbi:SMI1/KNR4 family protein [Paenibacillus tarimensis]|uniref:SMI1/KNR4 family protein n=1 Tax=Paenibacillus tarimensis TaxID=416012 RepID=UPI001F42FA9E|nr:SMI1/KNR4 family protein [Paenibacillus tarimensis]MCF2946428.1 SMI1/KNR4 family protein [Paenibacillus tarimensis]
MKQGELINKTLKSLKKRLNNNNDLLELQLGEGYLTEAKCTFNEPINEKDLLDFEKEFGLRIPEDYYNFLTITNGCSLFDHPEYGGEASIYRWQDTMDATYEDPKEGHKKLIIAYIYQDEIVIDLKAYNEGLSNYLMVKGHIDHFHQARPLNMNFELWFDRFIICQGEKFWTWPIYTADNYYKLRG